MWNFSICDILINCVTINNLKFWFFYIEALFFPPWLRCTIYSNCYNNIHNITTTITNVSDHCILSGIYKSKVPISRPKFRVIRNVKLITHSQLQLYIENNLFNTIFSENDPNKIANTLQQELNLIIDTIAPAKQLNLKKMSHIMMKILEVRYKTTITGYI